MKLNLLKTSVLLQVLVLLFFINICNSQEGINDSSGFNYESELLRTIPVPNSPEAEAFTQYGNVPVDMLKGAPSISIPLYEYKGHELNIPMSLTYDINARKVEDLATNVGLGWNLNLGGRISRITQGKPDDRNFVLGAYTSLVDDALRDEIDFYKSKIDNGFKFDDVSQLDGYFSFLNNIQNGSYDTQVDYYSLNVLGISDKITMDFENFSPHSLVNPRLKVLLFRVNSSIREWTVTDDNGNTYFFGLSEVTESSHANDFTAPVIAYKNNYNSSWVLTKIVSKNKRDVYEFDYEDFGYWNQENFFPVSKVINEVENGSNQTYHSIGSGKELNPGISYKIKQQHLKSIRHNNDTIVKIHLKERFDFEQNSAIDYIEVFDPLKQSLMYHYQFNHTYFGIPDTLDPASEESENIRLKLDSISIATSDGLNSSNYNGVKKYSFFYENPEQFPPRSSNSQDVLGFYNGSGASVLYPKVVLGNVTFLGPNRDFISDKAKIGILNKIIYPTKGSTVFEYEQHQEKKYEQVVSTEILANVSASNTDGNSSDCGTCCMDAFGSIVPFVSKDVFYVNSLGDYKYEFQNSSSVNISNRRSYIIGPFSNNQLSELYTIDDFIGCFPNNMPIVEEIYGASKEGMVQLNSGFYLLFAYNGDGQLAQSSTISNISLSIYETQSSQEIVTKKYPGLRIKSITDFTDDLSTKIAQKKSYLYKSDYNSPISGNSLRLNYSPILYYFIPERKLVTNGNNTDIVTVKSLHRLTKPIMYESPHITYNSVIEKLEANISQGGYTVHTFENMGISGIWPVGVSGVSNYTGNFRQGKIKNQSYHNALGDVVFSDSKNYFDESFFSTSGIYVEDNPLNHLKFITYKNTNDGFVTFYYQDGYMGGFGPSPGYDPPNNCEEYPNIKCISTKYSRLQYGYSRTLATTGGIIDRIKTNHFSNNSETMISENYEYYSSNKGYLLKKKSVSKSDGGSVHQEFFYPSNYNTNLHNQMVEKNHLTSVVKTKTTDNGKISQLKNEFIQIGSGFFVDKILSSKWSDNESDLEVRLDYEYHPTTKNIIEAQKPNGTITAFEWINKLPIIKVENPYYLKEGQSIYGYSALINALYDNIFPPLTLNALTDEELINQINIRLRSNSEFRGLVTSYTYNSYGGVTSITDPRGNTVYYEYDAMNRLKHVRDNEGNILSKKDYNYRTQN
ncbi:MAG: RHS repeat protein [Flavobacteriaceae bacterium]|nr:RHS repeat protein [Flavobacteriaceae bacterium]